MTEAAGLGTHGRQGTGHRAPARPPHLAPGPEDGGAPFTRSCGLNVPYVDESHALGAPGYPETMVVGRRRRTSSIGAVLLLIWLVIGAIAAAQRGYFAGGEANCATVSTIVVTVLAGPLNYVGVNPQIQCPVLPQPSQ